jgi:hypothetical protein
LIVRYRERKKPKTIKGGRIRLKNLLPKDMEDANINSYREKPTTSIGMLMFTGALAELTVDLISR